MDDFLYKLRNAKNRSGYDRSRRNQDSYPYRTGDRKRPKGKKPPKMSTMNSDQLDAIRKTLETIVENQKQLMEAEGVRLEIEERKALALEAIARMVGHLKGKNGRQLPVDEGQAAHRADKPPRAERDKVLKIIRGLREKGQTYERIAEYLETERIPTLSGKGKWRGQTIYRLYKETV